MLKKIFFIILSLNLLTHCEYKPVYSKQNNLSYKIIISEFSGDKDINNFIAANVKRTSKNDSIEIINISLQINLLVFFLMSNFLPINRFDRSV